MVVYAVYAFCGVLWQFPRRRAKTLVCLGLFDAVTDPGPLLVRPRKRVLDHHRGPAGRLGMTPVWLFEAVRSCSEALVHDVELATAHPRPFERRTCSRLASAVQASGTRDCDLRLSLCRRNELRRAAPRGGPALVCMSANVVLAPFKAANTTGLHECREISDA